MRTRHRVPTLVNMFMLDVFCCALGCVTLLWLLQSREARVSARDAEARGQEVTRGEARLVAARKQLEDETKSLGLARADVAELSKERDRLAGDLAAVSGMARDLSEELDAAKTELATRAGLLADARKRAAALEADLEKSRAERAAMTKNLTELQRQAADLDAAIKEKEKQLADAVALVKEREKVLAATSQQVMDREKARTEATKRAGDLASRLEAAEAREKQLREMLVTASASAKKDMREIADRYAAALARVQEMEKSSSQQQKDLDDARRSVVDLQGQKRTIADQLDKVRAAADNRFAGINLTGRRAVFVIDMSGSMELVDRETTEPNKWPTVIDTVAKVMNSLPDLEKFQVIIFSKQAALLFGPNADWKDFDKNASVAEVRRALAALKPAGDTNMHAAIEMAFGYRAAGLDAVYLFSDGLPNFGPGLTPSEAASTTMSETQRGEKLGLYIRNRLKQAWNRSVGNQRKVPINSVGFFYEDPAVGAFLWALSRENDGSFVGMSKP